MTADPQVAALQAALADAADAKTRDWWQRYLRGTIDFRGVGIPRIRALVREWRRTQGIDRWSAEEQWDLALRLFGQPLAEDKLAGVLFLQDHLGEAKPALSALSDFERLFARGLLADWNTVDWFCVRVLAPTIARGGSDAARRVAGWAKAADLWQARASVVGFVKIVEDRAWHPLLLAAAATLVVRPERFAKTGVGWILHELSVHDAEAVRNFIDVHLEHLSTEALRSAVRHLPAAERRLWLARRKAAGGVDVGDRT